MTCLYLLGVALFCLQAYANGAGPDSWQGPGLTDESNYIVEARGTLQLPVTPHPVTGYATLWMGLSSGDSDHNDFYQALAYNGAPDNKDCSGQDWCANAFVLHPSGNPTVGTKVHLAPGTKMTSHYKKQGNNMVETIEVNGKVVSTTSTPFAKTFDAYTAVECHTGPAGLIAAHTWTDLTVILAKPEKDAGGSFDGYELTTSDGGTTWHTTSYHVPAWDCKNDQEINHNN